MLNNGSKICSQNTISRISVANFTIFEEDIRPHTLLISIVIEYTHRNTYYIQWYMADLYANTYCNHDKINCCVVSK